MTWITDNKGAGPWTFTEKQNVWGYLNNLRWSSQADAQEFSEKVGNQIDRTDKHKPCGHWHKESQTTVVNIGSGFWYQQSIDVYNGKIGITFMRYEGDGFSDGLLGVVYENGVWKVYGIVTKMYVIYGIPNTCRLSSSGYMAYYCSCVKVPYYQPGDTVAPYYMRLYVFKEGETPRYTNVWSCDSITETPYYCWDYAIYNKMDCIGDRIACIGYLNKIDGVAYNRWRVMISEDAGLTFAKSFTFPADTSWARENANSHYLRMSDDGIIWVVRIVREGVAGVDPYYIQLWKSDTGATTFTKIWERNYYADTGYSSSPSFTWDLSDDGKYHSITMEKSPWSSYDRTIYVSDDYGVTFTVKTFSEVDNMYSFGVAADYIVNLGRERPAPGGYVFLRSVDRGTSFSVVDPNIYGGPSTTYVDIQKHRNEIVYSSCAQDFQSPPDYSESEEYNGLMYSSDGGATWRVIQTPVQNQDLESDQYVNGSTDITSEEPQIWPMD